MSESGENSSPESIEQEKSQHNSVLENLPKENKMIQFVQRLLNDVRVVNKSDGNAKQEQSAENEKLQQTGEQSYFLRLGTKIAARTNYSRDETSNHCPVYNSCHHTLDNCKAFKQISLQEKENAIHNQTVFWMPKK